MYKTTLSLRVRYSETDQMGYVYYGHYAAYYEVARVEALRRLGIAYKELEKQGVRMPVRRLECHYKAPAEYDNLLHIEVSIPEMPQSRIRFVYAIFNEAKECLNTGETELVFLRNQSLIRVPSTIIEALKPYFANPEAVVGEAIKDKKKTLS